MQYASVSISSSAHYPKRIRTPLSIWGINWAEVRLQPKHFNYNNDYNDNDVSIHSDER